MLTNSMAYRFLHHIIDESQSYMMHAYKVEYNMQLLKEGNSTLMMKNDQF